ncbi:MAG: VacB/RNase II family 3'-5' exoribonuclease, partial [Phycisphaerae bacterium]|nr:VacB/RNase II family 3'-5' exoribonuclease [Phycisphaerae bacterium]
LPPAKQASGRILGTYRHNRRGFGFVVPSDPVGHEDLYIPEGENGGAITGDIVAARITSRGQRDGKTMYTGRIVEVLERTHQRFVGTLQKAHGEWLVYPDGNTFTEPILTPDAAGRHIRTGTKVVVELTQWPDEHARAQGVITEVLGQAGQKDVDLRGVIIQFNLPGDFPEEARIEASNAVAAFDPRAELSRRLDLREEVICTIDPDDAKDYDDAISLRQLDTGNWELGVHIADVSFFVREGSALDAEARKRGNSTYFPGHVIPMLPEVLSNGVCSLQEGVPRLTKSVFITLDEYARPVATRFANSIIRSRKRLRYTEAQDLIDGREEIRHPDGPRRLRDYPQEVVQLLRQMDQLARRIQKRRLADGQLVLDLPEVELVLDDDGKVIDAVPEDTSYTHTLIEMFMVEANEAVARLLDGLRVPFLRRIHPEPEPEDSERLRQFVQVSGHRLPRRLDRQGIQSLLSAVRGKPEAFAINLAVLKSLTRAEYSPQVIGHYALASEHYCHFTSPIRRYADLTIHRLLDAFFAAGGAGQGERSASSRRRVKIDPERIPSEQEL